MNAPTRLTITEKDMHLFTAQLLRLTATSWHPAIRRALAKSVVTATGCLVYQGGKNDGWYKSIGHPDGSGRVIRLHRLACEATGIATASLMVCHRCDNPPCWNPDHLFVGTAADNFHDAMEKHRAKMPPKTDWPLLMRSARHHWQKLNLNDIPLIRARLARGEMQKTIASDYGVHKNTIHNIAAGIRWRHVQ